jgi:L-ascorbate metabolism protein UlaG (beta-lactamase superfamily)
MKRMAASPDAAALARRTFERIKELDHLHTARAPGPWQTGVALAGSLRFLRAALRNLLRAPRVAPLRPVPRPSAGRLTITFVGHATVLLTTRDSRVLTDPLLGDFLLGGLRRAQAAALHPEAAAEVSVVLLSHAHHDHLHLPSLRRLPRAAALVVPPRCASLVQPLGFRRVVVLEPGQTFSDRDVVVTAVPARHDGARGPLDWTWRGTNGYVVRTSGPAGVSAYFAGDTAYFSGFEEIGRRLRPQVALLPIAGYEPLALRATHMSPLDALYAFEDLGAELLIPIGHGSFATGYEPLEEPLRWLRELWAERAERGLPGRLAALGHGESCLVRGPETPRLAAASPVDEPPTVG